jgi:hypothetical protein
VRTIPAGRFTARGLKLPDEVAETRDTIGVTERGQRVAKLRPVEDPQSLKGSVAYLGSDEELMEPILEPWDLESG